jgi:hypothetical protein
MSAEITDHLLLLETKPQRMLSVLLNGDDVAVFLDDLGGTPDRAAAPAASSTFSTSSQPLTAWRPTVTRSCSGYSSCERRRSEQLRASTGHHDRIPAPLGAA